jgi:hypothetical protein
MTQQGTVGCATTDRRDIRDDMRESFINALHALSSEVSGRNQLR